MVLDTKTGSNLLQWLVVEVETLRTNYTDLGGITVDHGSFRLNPLDGAAAKDRAAVVGHGRRTGPLLAAILLPTAAVLLAVTALTWVRLAGQLPAGGCHGQPTQLILSPLRVM